MRSLFIVGQIICTLAALAALYVGATFVIVVAETMIDRVRGYQVLTLKTRMYWENGKAVAGDKVKTWRIAVPSNIWFMGGASTPSILQRIPIFSNRSEDFGKDRYFHTLTELTSKDEVVAGNYSRLDGHGQFSLTFSNTLPFLSLGPRGSPAYLRQLGVPRVSCVFERHGIDYHGWIVGIHSDDKRIAAERVCLIATETLDRWTLSIDDLLSKDSGQ